MTCAISGFSVSGMSVEEPECWNPAKPRCEKLKLRLIRTLTPMPAIVILDVMMSDILDGLDASRQMRLDKVLNRIPILMVSSITTSDYAGMFPTDEYIPIDNFLSKPVAPDKLVSEVGRLIKRT